MAFPPCELQILKETDRSQLFWGAREVGGSASEPPVVSPLFSTVPELLFLLFTNLQTLSDFSASGGVQGVRTVIRTVSSASGSYFFLLTNL